MLRLKTRAQFQAVLAQRVIAKTEHFALHRHSLAVQRDSVLLVTTFSAEPASQDTVAAPVLRERPLFSSAGPWLGAMVPKRWAKRSVTRHAIKRQIYEIAQAQLPQQDQAAYLVRLRSGFSRQQFLSSTSEALKEAVRAELQGLLARAGRPA